MSEQRMITCPNCGANLRIDDDRDIFFCEYCGTKIQNPTRKKINVQTEHTFRFVNQNKQERERAANEERNKSMSKQDIIIGLVGTALLLAFFMFTFGFSIIVELFGK